MGKIVSTGQITLTNLIESVTYIYYSATADGENATIEPVLEGKGLSKYMGIYNGPAIKYGQPDPSDPEQLDEYDSIKSQIKWSNYIGPKSISEKYEIRSNTEEVIKFINKENYSFSPDYIEFLIFDLEERRIVNNPDYIIKVIYIEESIREQCDVTSFFELRENNRITLDINNFLNKDIKEKDNERSHFILEKLLKSGEGFLTFYFKNKGEQILNKILRIRFGTTEEMAKFNVTASSINAAVQNSRMVFSSKGLDIYNGGFKIHKVTEKQNESVLWMDENTGNLIIHGNIYATDGEFNGIIKAKGGYFQNEISVLGNLSIGLENKIHLGRKDNLQGIFSDNYNSSNEKGFFITPEGKIYANEITLGKGAKISDYLQIGKHCYIQIPTDKNENSVISIVDDNNNRIFKITDEGKLTLGTGENGIVANGEDSSIGSTNYSKGVSGWYLSNEETELNNVTIRGIVKDTVFAHGEVQTVGGTLIVRPTFLIDKAYKYSEYELYVVTTKMDNTGISVGDYCQIGNRTGNEYFQIVYIEKKDGITRLEDCYYLRPLSTQNQAVQDEIDTPQCADNIQKLSFNENDNSVGLDKNSNIKMLVKKDPDNSTNVLYLSRQQGFEEIGIPMPEKPEELAFKIKNKMITGFYEQDFGEELEKKWGGLPLLTVASPAIDIETQTEYADNNVGIAINSTGGNNYAPTSISVFTENFQKKQDGSRTFVREDKIVLGDLGKGDENYCGNLKGYGLYAENVYLKGQLISDSGDFYSGINTASEVKMKNTYNGKNCFGDNVKLGEVLLWAGANNIDSIADAPFKVDSYGNLFASSGYFSGTIITDADITASTLKTAVIEGYKREGETENEAALTIRNTDKFIRFVSGDKEINSVIKMEFNSKNIKATMPFIISEGNLVTDNSIVLSEKGTINAKEIILRQKESKLNIKINNNLLTFGALGLKEKVLLNKQTYEKNKYYIKNEITQKYELCKEENFDPTKIYYKENDSNGSISYNFDNKELEFLNFNNKIFGVDNKYVNFYKDISFSSNTQIKQIKSIENNKTIGIDIYIKE